MIFRRNMRGQYFSFDAIIASVIFILTFVSLLSYWFSVKSSLESKEDEISKEAARVAEILFTPGYMIGAYNEKIVSRSEIEMFSQSYSPSYNPNAELALKKYLNTPYNVYIVFRSYSGEEYRTAGVKPTDSAQNIANVRRIFVMDNGTAQIHTAMDITLYQ
jgi:hypothetical protein